AAVGLPFVLIYFASLNARLVAADNAFRNFASLSFLIALLPIYWVLWRPAGRRIARLVGAAVITAVFGLAAFTFQVRPRCGEEASVAGSPSSDEKLGSIDSCS